MDINKKIARERQQQEKKELKRIDRKERQQRKDTELISFNKRVTRGEKKQLYKYLKLIRKWQYQELT